MKKSLIAIALLGLAIAPAAAGGNGNDVTQGNNHGAATTDYHEDGGNTGQAIGGLGNSDGDMTNGQAHSDEGRGQQVQDFLGSNYNIGSQKEDD